MSFIDARDGEISCRGALTETGDLRENEPHPMALLSTPSDFLKGAHIDRLLGSDESGKIKRIRHCKIFDALDGGDKCDSPPGIHPDVSVIG